jgi:hypothetical protein
MLSNIDVFDDEYHQFQWDVHILIKGTLAASIEYLNREAKTELAKIKEQLEKPASDEYGQYLVDEHVDVLATNAAQERFLRNMALVALASRLTHSLRKMASLAETFSPREKKYGDKSMSEFARLWLEYSERFGIDFERNSARIDFVDKMREVRNQIVHDGSEANTIKPLDEADLNGGYSGWLDTEWAWCIKPKTHGCIGSSH